MRIETNRESMFSNVKIWVILFAIGTVWESAIRVLISHDSWGVSNSISYVAGNLIFSVVLAIVLGGLHSILLMMLEHTGRYRQRLQGLITPAAGVVVAAFLVAVALSWQMKNNMTLKSMLTVGIFVTIYLPCILLFRFVAGSRRIGGISVFRRRAIILGLLLTPVMAVIFIQAVRGSDPKSQAATNHPISRVILISIDTLRYDYVSAYGHSYAKTPTIDSIAAQGVLYKFAISLVAETTPSHISMFTGEYPWVYGMFHNGIPLGRKVSTLTQYLRNAGYHTGGFISGLPLKSAFSGLDRGFQTYDDRLSIKDFFQETFLGRIVAKAGFFPRGYLRQAKEVTDPALRWLDKNAGSPFFLFLHYYDAHYPYGIKKRIRYVADPFLIQAKPSELPVQKQLYAKEVESVDAQIGRIKEFLQQRGIYDKTLIIITSDHGESLGEHNYYYDHGDYVYEQLLRVPLMIRYPPLIKPGSVVKQQVVLLDLYKTILSATGVQGPKRADGYNLIQLAQGGAPPDYDRVFPSDSFGAVGIRTQEWKFIRNKKKTTFRYELYDLLNDPAEMINLVEIKKAKAMEMQQTMARMFRSIQTNVRHDLRPGELSEEQLEELRSLGYANQ